MKKSIVIIALSALAGFLGSCSSAANNDPWSVQHHKAKNKVIFPVG